MQKNIMIEATNLTKKFGSFNAVNEISFSIERGRIFGFLGANGAGKTTTIRMMCGLLEPSSGMLQVAGFNVAKHPEQVRRHIGYMSQLFSMYPDLTAEENLRFYGEIYGLKNIKLEERIHKVLDELELIPYKEMLAGRLPLGFKQRLGLASATLHQPEIIFLDEPTSGVDPVARVKFWAYVQKVVKSYGTTAIVTTHFLNEAEYCDYILLMHEGKIAAQGTPNAMKEDINQQIKIYQIETDAGLKELFSLRQYDYIKDVYSWGRNFRITVLKEASSDSAGLLTDLQAMGFSIHSIEEIKPSLEDVFIRHYQS